jgi:hypothetical protein
VLLLLLFVLLLLFALLLLLLRFANASLQLPLVLRTPPAASPESSVLKGLVLSTDEVSRC